MPFATKDVAIIWWSNLVSICLCYFYVYVFNKGKQDKPVEDNQTNKVLPPLVSQIIRALDYGSGQERGARKQ